MVPDSILVTYLEYLESKVRDKEKAHANLQNHLFDRQESEKYRRKLITLMDEKLVNLQIEHDSLRIRRKEMKGLLQSKPHTEITPAEVAAILGDEAKNLAGELAPLEASKYLEKKYEITRIELDQTRVLREENFDRLRILNKEFRNAESLHTDLKKARLLYENARNRAKVMRPSKRMTDMVLRLIELEQRFGERHPQVETLRRQIEGLIKFGKTHSENKPTGSRKSSDVTKFGSKSRNTSKATTAAAGSDSSSEIDMTSIVKVWNDDVRALGKDSQKRRAAAIESIFEAMNGDVPEMQLAALQAFGQLGGVKFDKDRFRKRILEFVTGDHSGNLQRVAFYALLNTQRDKGDLALLQKRLLEPRVESKLDSSASHLLLSFGEGVIEGPSEEIVLNLLNSKDRKVRREVLRGLWGAKISDKLAARIIELVDDQESHHDAIYYALSTLPDKNSAVVEKLIEVLSDPDWNNWGRAIWGLGYGVRKADELKVAKAMLEMHNARSDPKTRKRCANLVRKYGDEKTIAKLRAAAQQQSSTLSSINQFVSFNF